VAKFDKVIPPGQEGKIHMVIDGKKVHGEFNKAATVRTNDPEHPMMSISMAGSITPYIAVTPTSRLYLQGQYGETVEKSITLRSNETDLDLEITKVESNIDDKITYKTRHNEEDGVWVVEVWKNPKLPTTSTFGTLTIHTNSENSPTKTVQVQVITKGSITIEPRAVNFGTVKIARDGEPAESVTREVLVLKADGEFQIEDVVLSSKKFAAEIEPIQPGKRYRILVTFTPPAEKKARQTHVGDMTVRTNDPREPELKVRLVARSM
jgi:hypothetical protein